MEVLNLLQIILKFILLGYGIKSYVEACKARENDDLIKEFRYLLWTILLLLSFKD